MFRPNRRPEVVPPGELAVMLFSFFALLLTLVATVWMGQVAHATELSDSAQVRIEKTEDLQGALILIAERELIVQNNKQISHKVQVPDDTPITLNGRTVMLDDLKPGLFVDVKAKRNDAGNWVAQDVRARMLK